MTCVYQKTLSLILLSTTAHNRGRPFLIALGGNFSHVRPVLLLDVRRRLVRTAPRELNPSPAAVAFHMEINA